MKVLSVVGARPQFVKLSPIAHAMEAAGHNHVIVHTGQHYDANMSDSFFEHLGIPQPTVHLGVGSGSHGVQTGKILGSLDPVLLEHKPDWVLVYGDTNSTIAAALSAVKLDIRVAHLEAGLRSFNRKMPEEHNRVATDHLADLCLAPTDVAKSHLVAEGLGERTVVTGDVMTDVCMAVARQSPVIKLQLDATERERFVLATIHRAENTDNGDRLSSIIAALASLPIPVILTAHPRLTARAHAFDIDLNQGALRAVDPFDYPQMIAAVQMATAVVTDSGGLQKEAFLLRTPCTTVRGETEWTETVDLGWNILCPDPRNLLAAVLRPAPRPTTLEPYGDGSAAQAVVRILEERA